MSASGLDRPFLTFNELAMRWAGDANLVRHALVNGRLIPTIYLSADASEEGDAMAADGGSVYLHAPKLTAVLDCNYTKAAAEVKPSDAAQCWALREPVALEAVLSHGVIDFDQVERYELANPRKISLDSVRLGLRTLERASLLKMVIGMAIHAYGYDPRDRRSVKIPLIGESVRQLGMTIDDDTVRKFVYEAAEAHLPMNWREHKRAA